MDDLKQKKLSGYFYSLQNFSLGVYSIKVEALEREETIEMRLFNPSLYHLATTKFRRMSKDDKSEEKCGDTA